MNKPGWVNIVPISGFGWKVRSVEHLSPEDNKGKHNIYINAFNGAENIRGNNIFVKWGWSGQHSDELSPSKPFDKPIGEPGCNVPIEKGMHAWIEIDDLNHPSERVENLYAEFDLEGRPGNSIEHNSYIVIYEFDMGLPVIVPTTANLQRIRELAYQIIDLTN